MNTNPNAIRILCFGDSNTRGRHPNGVKERYPANVRWTGLLQQKLGDGFEIIEEGVSGRTTVFDGEGSNGKAYLKPCLESHNPLDIVVLMMGTNDLIASYNRSSETIANGIEELIIMIKEFAWNKDEKAPEIILLSTPPIDESVSIAEKKFKGAEEKAKQLATHCQQIAEKYECAFIDTTKHIQPSKIDGYHFDADGHRALSEVLAEKIKGLVKS